jgi:uncharacterized protein DUF4398
MKYRMKYRATHPVRSAVALALGVSILLGSLSAYGSNASDLAKQHVAQSDTSVEQARQTLGKSEHGTVELQQARDKLDAAKSALAKKDWKEAERAAAQAHLFAELAVAKSQSAAARKSADEVLASLEILRQETERNTPTQR